MRGRIAYRKLMLYHNIVRSDNRRIVKRIIEAQERETRETTWLAVVKQLITKYDIDANPKEMLKSSWKKLVKEAITKHEEGEIREKCRNSTKSRLVKEDPYDMKEYLKGKVSAEAAKQIVRVRMNMSDLPANYKNKHGGSCPLCNKGLANVEHYLRCPQVRLIQKAWDVKEEDLYSTEVAKMRDVAKFVEKIEMMVESTCEEIK